MINEEKIQKLLIKSLENYIHSLEIDDFNYLQYKGEIYAYTNILDLDNEKFNINYLDINIAKKILFELKDSEIYRTWNNDGVLK